MTRRYSAYEPATAYATPPVHDWPDRACAAPDVDPEIFYPATSHAGRDARRICSRCPHRKPCLDWALDTGQAFGIWAGTTPDERHDMRKDNR